MSTPVKSPVDWITIGGSIASILALFGVTLAGSLPFIFNFKEKLEVSTTKIPRSTWERSPIIPTPKPSPAIELWEKAELKGRDSQGRTADLIVHVLSQEYNWALASSTMVQHLGKDQDPDVIRKHLKQSGLERQMRIATDIIAVGTASCEGSIEEERERARARADRLLIWLRESMPGFDDMEQRPDLWRLNLGKYRGECDSDGSSRIQQRRIIFLTVVKKDPGIDLEGALRNAINSSGALGFQLDEYHDFEMILR
jgi:hypothetical protein